MRTAKRKPSSTVPTADETRIARDSIRKLSRALRSTSEVRVQMCSGDAPSDGVAIPPRAARLLAQILDQMANGTTFSVVPAREEMTTQQAADFLNVSRPFVIKLIEDGLIPVRRVGTHRRIRLADIERYRERDDARRKTALHRLVAEGQSLELGY